MKETYSYFVVLELRADTEPKEEEIEIDIVKDEEFYGGTSGLYKNLETAKKVMTKRIKEIVKEDNMDCDDNHRVSYFIKELDGYVCLHDTIADDYDWVYKRFYIKEVKM